MAATDAKTVEVVQIESKTVRVLWLDSQSAQAR